MGRSIECKFVGAYIKVGKKEFREIDLAFSESTFNELFDGEFFDYLDEKIPSVNRKDWDSVICPIDDEAQITGELTPAKIEAVRNFVATRYATEMEFLRTIFGTAEVVVGIYEYDDEIG